MQSYPTPRNSTNQLDLVVAKLRDAGCDPRQKGPDLWDIASGKLLREFGEDAGYPGAVSPNGK